VVAETLATCNIYTRRGDAFSRAVRGEIALRYGLEDVICNTRIIDALFKSGRSAHGETV